MRTEQAVNGVPDIPFAFLFLSFLFKVNKGVNQFQLFMCLGFFYHLSRIYGRFGFSYVWFGAFFFSSLVISFFIGDLVFIWFVRKGVFFSMTG